MRENSSYRLIYNLTGFFGFFTFLIFCSKMLIAESLFAELTSSSISKLIDAQYEHALKNQIKTTLISREFSKMRRPL